MVKHECLPFAPLIMIIISAWYDYSEPFLLAIYFVNSAWWGFSLYLFVSNKHKDWSCPYVSKPCFSSVLGQDYQPTWRWWWWWSWLIIIIVIMSQKFMFIFGKSSHTGKKVVWLPYLARFNWHVSFSDVSHILQKKSCFVIMWRSRLSRFTNYHLDTAAVYFFLLLWLLLVSVPTGIF